MRWYGLMLVLFIWACGAGNNNTLSEEAYVKLVVDIQVAQAATKDLKGAVKDSVYAVYMTQIAEKHNIEEEAIHTYLVDLEKDVDKMIRVYEEAQIYLNKKD